MPASPGSTGRSAPGCCCSRAGGGLRSRRPVGPTRCLLLLFAIGAVAMRGAGCTLNDIADRHYDAQVARTRLRPLPSGAVTVRQAVLFLLVQLAVGAAVLLSLNRTSVVLGFAVLGLIGTYPFMKRITYWPQVFLGLNFNWGALLGWTAVTGAARLAAAAALSRRRVLDGRIRHDLRASGQGGRRPDRRQILGDRARLAHPARGSSPSTSPRCCCGRRRGLRPGSASCSGPGSPDRRCSWPGRRLGWRSTTRPIASPSSARTARSAG